MASPSPAQKLSNLAPASSLPVPPFQMPKFPERLRQIDPDGVEKYEQDMARMFADWHTQFNTIWGNAVNQLSTFVKK